MPDSDREFLISLPSPVGEDPGIRELPHGGAVVVVGANGAGKTRLGTWIELESPHKEAVHRVSAQRSLNMPESVSTRNIEEALNDLYYGYADAKANFNHKPGHRWGGKPSVSLLNDYQRLLVYLFSEEFDESTRYRQQALATKEWRPPPPTKLDTLRAIWHDTLPERELKLGGGRVQAGPPNDETLYSGSEMSDGERVVFYLIGQCLAAPEGAVIVIDEPEIHLHRAIQGRLWDQIEAHRQDCQFVYLTHDVDFAATRHRAVKVWLKRYDGSRWEWATVPADQPIPEALLLALIGSRKPILFVEGEAESLDSWLYSTVFPEHTVVPSGSCEAVIQNVSSFRRLTHLHSLDCFGLIDRDFRSDEEVALLADRGVYCTLVAQVENLFLTDDTLTALCERLNIKDTDSVISELSTRTLELAAENRQVIINAWTQSELHRRLRRVSLDGENREAFEGQIGELREHLDLESVYGPAEAEIERILGEGDVGALLRYYKNKGLLPAELAPRLGLAGKDIFDTLKRLTIHADGGPIRQALRGSLPQVPRNTNST